MFPLSYGLIYADKRYCDSKHFEKSLAYCRLFIRELLIGQMRSVWIIKSIILEVHRLVVCVSL